MLFSTFQNPLSIIFLFFGYAVIGGGIKYIDQAFDEKAYDRKLAIFVSAIISIIMAYFISVDHSSAIIFISIILGVAISRKIDNLGFSIGVLIVLLASFAYNYFISKLSVDWALIAFLSFAAFVDEYGNDLADQGKLRGIVNFFFDNRGAMKFVVLVFVLFNIFQWIYLVAFLLFDFSYTLVGLHSQRKFLRFCLKFQ